MNTTDNPGVHVPPPLIYAVIFAGAVFIQKKFFIDKTFFGSRIISYAGVLFLLLAVFFIVRSIAQFIRTKNTIVPNKAAESLQTNGVYHTTRNPMYLGLLMIYIGLSCLVGNWWNFILLPLLLVIIQQYVIKREERYLTRKFGKEYTDYTLQVRRWI